jgi:hypothetical protein
LLSRIRTASDEQRCGESEKGALHFARLEKLCRIARNARCGRLPQ